MEPRRIKGNKKSKVKKTASKQREKKAPSLNAVYDKLYLKYMSNITKWANKNGIRANIQVLIERSSGEGIERYLTSRLINHIIKMNNGLGERIGSVVTSASWFVGEVVNISKLAKPGTRTMVVNFLTDIGGVIYSNMIDKRIDIEEKEMVDSIFHSISKFARSVVKYPPNDSEAESIVEAFSTAINGSTFSKEDLEMRSNIFTYIYILSRKVSKDINEGVSSSFLKLSANIIGKEPTLVDISDKNNKAAKKTVSALIKTAKIIQLSNPELMEYIFKEFIESNEKIKIDDIVVICKFIEKVVNDKVKVDQQFVHAYTTVLKKRDIFEPFMQTGNDLFNLVKAIHSINKEILKLIDEEEKMITPPSSEFLEEIRRIDTSLAAKPGFKPSTAPDIIKRLIFKIENLNTNTINNAKYLCIKTILLIPFDIDAINPSSNNYKGDIVIKLMEGTVNMIIKGFHKENRKKAVKAAVESLISFTRRAGMEDIDEYLKKWVFMFAHTLSKFNTNIDKWETSMRMYNLIKDISDVIDTTKENEGRVLKAFHKFISLSYDLFDIEEIHYMIERMEKKSSNIDIVESLNEIEAITEYIAYKKRMGKIKKEVANLYIYPILTHIIEENIQTKNIPKEIKEALIRGIFTLFSNGQRHHVSYPKVYELVKEIFVHNPSIENYKKTVEWLNILFESINKWSRYSDEGDRVINILLEKLKRNGGVNKNDVKSAVLQLGKAPKGIKKAIFKIMG